MSGNLDIVTGNEDPATGADSALIARVEPTAGKPRRPFWWTVSAWIFIGIGLFALIDTLAGLYSRPMALVLNPGLALLFAGVALLTLNRRWRRAAVIALFLALLAGGFVIIMMAISPEHASVGLPVLNLSATAAEKPRWAAAGSICLALAIGWPCYLLMCTKAKALFGMAGRK